MDRVHKFERDKGVKHERRRDLLYWLGWGAIVVGLVVIVGLFWRKIRNVNRRLRMMERAYIGLGYSL